MKCCAGPRFESATDHDSDERPFLAVLFAAYTKKKKKKKKVTTVPIFTWM